jgi:hypothetical protein
MNVPQKPSYEKKEEICKFWIIVNAVVGSSLGCETGQVE